MSQIQSDDDTLDVTAAPVFGLDPEKVGNALLRLGAISAQLGHAEVKSTLRPYCSHPDALSPETQFVYDIITQPTSVIAERWYCGELGACVIAVHGFAQMMAGTADGP